MSGWIMLAFGATALAGTPLALALGLSALLGLAISDVDFGMLPATPGDGAGGQALTQQAAQYHSPEQVAGWPADARSDVYALGVTYFALLTGGPPLFGESVAATLHAQLHNPLPDPCQRAKDAQTQAGQKERDHRDLQLEGTQPHCDSASPGAAMR